MTILIRRGLDSARTGITPASGEPIWTTDTNKLYVGDGFTAGGIAVGGSTGSSGTLISSVTLSQNVTDVVFNSLSETGGYIMTLDLKPSQNGLRGLYFGANGVTNGYFNKGWRYDTSLTTLSDNSASSGAFLTSVYSVGAGTSYNQVIVFVHSGSCFMFNAIGTAYNDSFAAYYNFNNAGGNLGITSSITSLSLSTADLANVLCTGSVIKLYKRV